MMDTIVFGLVRVTVGDMLDISFKNGKHLKGYIIDNNSKGFIIKNAQEETKVQTSDIKHIKKLGKVKKYEAKYNWLK